jgi:hypothetical protein
MNADLFNLTFRKRKYVDKQQLLRRLMKRVPIGEFSRMTHVSIKTLPDYHDVDLLAPDAIDPSTGYRYYAISQIRAAQVIRRLRALGMPVDEVRRDRLHPGPRTDANGWPRGAYRHPRR